MPREDYQVITEITHVIRGGRCVGASQPSLPYEITGNVAYLITIGPCTSHDRYYVITWIEAVQSMALSRESREGQCAINYWIRGSPHPSLPANLSHSILIRLNLSISQAFFIIFLFCAYGVLGISPFLSPPPICGDPTPRSHINSPRPLVLHR